MEYHTVCIMLDKRPGYKKTHVPKHYLVKSTENDTLQRETDTFHLFSKASFIFVYVHERAPLSHLLGVGLEGQALLLLPPSRRHTAIDAQGEDGSDQQGGRPRKNNGGKRENTERPTNGKEKEQKGAEED